MSFIDDAVKQRVNVVIWIRSYMLCRYYTGKISVGNLVKVYEDIRDIKQMILNPLTPRRTLVAPFTKISILF